MNNKKFENSHHLLKNILTFAQFCGLFPLYNIRNPNPEQLKFKWFSWKVFHTVIIGFASLFCTILGLKRAITEDTLISQLTNPLFFLCVLTSIMVFTLIAKQWPPFIKELCKIEEDFSKKYKCTISIKIRLRIATILLFALAFGEHILSTMTFIYAVTCKNKLYGWEKYSKNEFHYIFIIFPYHFVYAIIILIFTWISWVIWNFGDIFIILLSIIMSTRFKQISNTLKMNIRDFTIVSNFKVDYRSKFKGSHLSILEKTFFSQIREDYNKMASICIVWDNLFSNLVVASYAYNLSFILIQLFNSLRRMDSTIERIYFFYSFGFVIMRTIVVSICAASVNQESKQFLPILNSVPSDFYCIEIQRLITQIHVDSSALTGHNFFRITRGMVLNVAAAIITYELVLIQFNQTTLEKYMSVSTTLCY